MACAVGPPRVVLAASPAGQAAQGPPPVGAFARVTPNPAATLSVFIVQLVDLIAHLGVRECQDALRLLAKPVLLLLIRPWPAGMVSKAQQVTWTGLAQYGRYALVKPRRIAKASPDFIPFAATLEQGIGRSLSSVLIRIETEFTPANIFESRPAIWIAARLECLAVAHPAEQIANGITDGQPIEIVGFQSVTP